MNERAKRPASGVKHNAAIVGGGLMSWLLAWRAALSGLGVALYDPNDRLGNLRGVSFLEPRPDAKHVYADANQICWNKAKLRRAKANYADERAVDN
jgi:NADPH-dependent 2,4-dienoyl-CoA reductase/sulfur reductase-like enzyme